MEAENEHPLVLHQDSVSDLSPPPDLFSLWFLSFPEHRYDTFPAYSGRGIIVAGIEEILHNFSRLVGYHDIKDKQPIMDDLLATKGQL